MPITDSAIKAMRQSARRKQRRQPVKTVMKTMMKNVVSAAESGNLDEAKRLLPLAYKAIDMAAKKHLIHPKNAARKKSNVARLLSK